MIKSVRKLSYKCKEKGFLSPTQAKISMNEFCPGLGCVRWTLVFRCFPWSTLESMVEKLSLPGPLRWLESQCHLLSPQSGELCSRVVGPGSKETPDSPVFIACLY